MQLKKTIEPSQVTAIRDNREKADIDLAPLNVVQGTLATGDFSVVGLEHVIAVERKSLQDLIMCVGRERERFDREMQRLAAYQVRALVIETDWATIELKRYRGEIHPNAVLGSLLGWMAQGIPVVMTGTNERAGRFISRMLFTAARRRYTEALGFLNAVAQEPQVDIAPDSPVPDLRIPG